MTPARFRTICWQEKVPQDGVWKAVLDTLKRSMPEKPEGTPEEVHEAGLRAMLRLFKRKGLTTGGFPVISDDELQAEMAAIVAQDPALRRALESHGEGQGEGQGIPESEIPF